MLSSRTSTILYSAAVLGLLPLALAHSDEHGAKMEMSGMAGMKMAPGHGHGPLNMSMTLPEDVTSEAIQYPPTYFRYDGYSMWMWGHIVAMVISWCVVLPVAVMFSIARSRYTLPVQATFLATNALGVVLSMIYRANVPDLYEHNVHYRMGWLFTWLALAWVVLAVIDRYANSRKASRRETTVMSIANMRYHETQQEVELPQFKRWSRDSGQGTDRNSTSLFGSSSGSPNTDSEDRRFDRHLPTTFEPHNEDDEAEEDTEKTGFLGRNSVDRFLTSNVPRVIGGKVPTIVWYTHLFLERSMIILGWFALMSGGIVFGGILQGRMIFNGLAHFIKGGIFFWYGILTLGRWAGAFADFGWAWNVKPPAELVGRFRAWVPSGEFTESFVICFYGCSNVWLEHLSNAGGAWKPSDLEHVSITILFFGGGLLGMLIESRRLRSLLQTSLYSTQGNAPTDSSKWTAPNHYSVPLNPLPGLVIMLLGIMMSSHTQDSMVSSMIHKQWGTLFVGFALARGATYILIYLKPYTSYLPSRPPTELITSFCLSSGGLLFIASSSSIVEVMEYNDLDAMFLFTVGMGLTALLMAWSVVLLALLGWAKRREDPDFWRRLDAANEELSG